MLQKLQTLKKNDKLVTAESKTGPGAPYIKRHFRARKSFLKAWEACCVNVSAACAHAGISRMTYYRWMKSPKPADRAFRAKLDRIRPDERLLDAAEATIIQRVEAGDLKAAMFVLKTKGRDRGWNEKFELPTPSATDIAVKAIEFKIEEFSRLKSNLRGVWEYLL